MSFKCYPVEVYCSVLNGCLPGHQCRQVCGRSLCLNGQIVRFTVLWERLYHTLGKCTCIFILSLFENEWQLTGQRVWVADTLSSFFISAPRCTDSDLWLCKACEGYLDFDFITGCDEYYTALSLWSNCCKLENAPVFYLLCLMLFITKCLDSCIYLPYHFHWNCSVRFLFGFFPVL